MAAFNPQLPQTQAQDFTYTSRGIGTSKTFSTLFDGARSLGTDYLKAKDTQNQLDIYNQTVAGRDAAAAGPIAGLNEQGYLDSPTGGGGAKGGPSPGAGAVTPSGPSPGQISQGIYPGRQPPAGAPQKWVTSFPADNNPGVDPATTGSTSQGPQGGSTATQPLPPALATAQTQVADWGQALAQGTMSKPYHDLQMLNLSKELHMRYPGYGQQIDSIVQNVTGEDPTNALVNDAIQISNANAVSGKTAETEWHSYVFDHQNTDAIATLYPDITTNPKYSDPKVRADVQAHVMQFNATRNAVSAETAQLSLKEKQGTLQADDVLKSGLGRASVIDSTAAQAADSIGGMSKILDGYTKNPMSANPQVIEGMVMSAQQIRAQQQQAITRWLDQGIHLEPDGSFSGQTNRQYLATKGQNAIDQVIAAATQNTDFMLDRLNNKAYGWVNWAANNQKIGLEYGTNKVWNSSLAMRMYMIAGQIDPKYRDQLFDPAVHNDNASALQNTNADVMSAAALTGTTGDPKRPDAPTLGDETANLQAHSGLSDPDINGTLNAHIDKSLRILSTSTEPDVVKNEVNYFFADSSKGGNPGFMDLLPDKDKANVFARFASPAVRANVFAMSKKDPALWQTYSTWMMKGTQSILATDFESLGNGVSSVPGAGAKFDPRTFTVTYTPPKQILGRGVLGAIDTLNQTIKNDAASKATQRINIVLQNVKQLSDMEGSDPLKALGGVVKNINEAVGQKPVPSLINQVLGPILDDLNPMHVIGEYGAALQGKKPGQTADGDFSNVGGDEVNPLRPKTNKDARLTSNPDLKWGGADAGTTEATPADYAAQTARTATAVANIGPDVKMDAVDRTPPEVKADMKNNPGHYLNTEPGHPGAATPDQLQLLRAPAPMDGTVTEAAKQAIRVWEEDGKVKLTTYDDGTGTPTNGYGHTGRDVKWGQKITQEEADANLDADTKHFTGVVNSLVKVPLTVGQHTALLGFAMNEGEGALAKSTLLKDINSGNLAAVPDDFRMWNKAKDHNGNLTVWPGLVKRREKEIAMWNGSAQPGGPTGVNGGTGVAGTSGNPSAGSAGAPRGNASNDSDARAGASDNTPLFGVNGLVQPHSPSGPADPGPATTPTPSTVAPPQSTQPSQVAQTSETPGVTQVAQKAPASKEILQIQRGSAQDAVNRAKTDSERAKAKAALDQIDGWLHDFYGVEPPRKA